MKKNLIFKGITESEFSVTQGNQGLQSSWKHQLRFFVQRFSSEVGKTLTRNAMEVRQLIDTALPHSVAMNTNDILGPHVSTSMFRAPLTYFLNLCLHFYLTQIFTFCLRLSSGSQAMAPAADQDLFSFLLYFIPYSLLQFYFNCCAVQQ